MARQGCRYRFRGLLESEYAVIAAVPSEPEVFKRLFTIGRCFHIGRIHLHWRPHALARQFVMHGSFDFVVRGVEVSLLCRMRSIVLHGAAWVSGRGV